MNDGRPSQNLLAGLPRLAALDDETRALFTAVRRRIAGEVNAALDAGAKLEAVEPYRVVGEDVEGGTSALQLACSPWPGKPVALEVLSTLLDAGANPNGNATGQGSALRRLAESLPSNGPAAAEILIKAGALPDVGLVAAALLAERLWIQPGLARNAIAIAETFWSVLPDDERALLDPHLPTQLIGTMGGTAQPELVSRAKWVLDRLPTVKPAPSVQGEPTPATPAPGRRRLN